MIALGTNEDAIKKLKKYVEKGIFSSEQYNVLTVLPSDPDIRGVIDGLLELCIHETIEALKKEMDKKQIKIILQSGIQRFNKKIFDTEDREFICECFNKIAQFVEVDFASNLNIWLYGKVLGTLLKTHRN